MATGKRSVDVIGVAGVSRKTFYELFDSKEDCFLAAYDVLLGNLLGETADGFESRPGAPWAERVAPAALRQFTGFLEVGCSETSVELPGITALSLAGGVNEPLYSEILHGASAQLPDRLPDLAGPALPRTEGASAERERVRRSTRNP